MMDLTSHLHVQGDLLQSVVSMMKSFEVHSLSTPLELLVSATRFSRSESPGKSLQCSSGSIQPSELLSFAKSQVDYILGDNPRATSYMVGYRNNYPRQVHHWATSIVSIKEDSSFISC
ncbi:endoglucanase 6-like [Eucalyptus grandis]|uniref:endoglucanase 6-like n=1 Tax=Eucalyptus grandis TaxID=71139 RepID=UPI00192ED0B1|nr:endoglucanase 6-like [Eucalyptus grandis]